MKSKLYFPIAILLNAIVAFGQGADTAGSKSFATRCAGCHGADARGTDRGPGLAGSRRLRAQSILQVRSIIRKGVPASGMPAFDLPAGELDALAALVHSLTAPAAEEALPGDAKAGEQFFFGKGQCTSCHMVQGRGATVGPDLSNAGARLTADEIRGSPAFWQRPAGSCFTETRTAISWPSTSATERSSGTSRRTKSSSRPR
jgi:mono/diheme cytochrome c family protein